MSVAKTRRNAAKGNSRKLIVIAGIALCLVVSGYLLYPSLREYYLAYRANEQLQQEYSDVEARNDQISQQITYLTSDEGIADRARERFGWVTPGDQVVNITGLDSTDTTAALPAEVPAGSGTAPDTWWTKFLDAIFFVQDTTTTTQQVPDPFIPS